MSANMSRKNVQRLLLLAAIVGIFAAAWQTGAFELFRDLDRLRALIASWGPWAYVLFIATFTVLQPLGIPAVFWILAAGLAWSFPVAFALSMTGAVCGASLGFFFARYLARDWVAARLPERIRRYDNKIAANGLRAVILIRLVFLLAPYTHWILGLSKVRYSAFVLGTVIGSTPNIGIVTWFGEVALRWLGTQSPLIWGAVGAAIVMAIVTRRVIARRAKVKPAEE